MKIIGVGAALIDLLIEENDKYISEIGSEKGGMTLVEGEQIAGYLQKANSSPEHVPGGSACNTIVGIGRLGGNVSFMGCCGNDNFGKNFIHGLENSGVENLLKIRAEETGRVLSVVTPDTQRTMFTFLGAAGAFSQEDIEPNIFDGAGIVHVEGYLLFNKDLMMKVLEEAKKSGAKISLDLASFQVVEATKELLESIIPDWVDILLANEDEAKAYTGKNEEDSLEFFSDLCEIAVVKKGKKGALIARGKERETIGADLVQAVDTTGAGDLWASGFLHGISQGLSLKESGNLGAKVASEVVQVIGASIPEEGWIRIKTLSN